MRIYEEAGMSEYWMAGRDTVDIYYLVGGKYCLEETLVLCDDEYDKNYNVDAKITLREFPNVQMTLGSIFEDLWQTVPEECL